MRTKISDKTIGRLSLYRRILGKLAGEKASHVFSHQLASKAGVTAAQVRRDVMVVGYEGSSSRGYEVVALMRGIGEFLDTPRTQCVALVGVGNLGRALLAYFSGRRPKLKITAAFDVDPRKTGRVILGCRCYPMEEIPRVLAEQDIRTAIIAVPAGDAQVVADTLTRNGVKGLVNFAPTPLRVPPSVYVSEIDFTTTLEKVAYFARRELVE